MPSTLNSEEIKTVVLGKISSDLAVRVPLSPLGLDGPVEVFNPSLGSVSGNCSIGVAGVEQDSNAIHFQNLVDPKGCLGLHVIIKCGRAHVPSGGAVRNVQSCSDGRIVQIVGEGHSGDDIVLVAEEVLDPWSVLGSLFAPKVVLFNSVDHSRGVSRDSAKRVSRRWLIEIVPIKRRGELLRLVPNCVASFWSRVGLEIVEVVNTVIRLQILNIVVWNEVETIHSSWEGRGNIVIPISCTVSNDVPLQIVGVRSGVMKNHLLEVELVDLPREVWNVDSTVAFAGDEEVVSHVFWEFSVPLVESFEGIL